MGLFVAIISLGFIASAHSGRTDGSGGQEMYLVFLSFVTLSIKG